MQQAMLVQVLLHLPVASREQVEVSSRVELKDLAVEACDDWVTADGNLQKTERQRE